MPDQACHYPFRSWVGTIMRDRCVLLLYEPPADDLEYQELCLLLTARPPIRNLILIWISVFIAAWSV